MLSNFLRNNDHIFKLVCGAGNEDVVEVEKLVALYSRAGCSLFDVSAYPDVVDAAKRGIERSGIKDDRYICVSVGIKGDPHINKAEINRNLCTKCGSCWDVCLQNAVYSVENAYRINNKRCIGCGKCRQVCPANCVDMYSKASQIKDLLPPLISKGIDCIEFHAVCYDEQEVQDVWRQINNLYPGILSICIDRSKLGNESLLARIKKMLQIREPYTTIIQADGAPMSGGVDDYKTTLQAVAAAEIFQDENLPVYLFLSGGTNSKSIKLAELCGIKANGVAVGSYARKLVRSYIQREDFWTNDKIFNEALEIAKGLVQSSKCSNYDKL